jgi:molecular chaperone DnaK
MQRTLKRSELEILTRDLVERTLTACRQVLKDAKLKPEQIDQVVLVGGMTRMPLVQRSVKELFGRDPHKGADPDEVVAVGAAIQGAAITGAIDEVLLLDVAPLSIGVETGGGVFTCLIPRNTTVPTERSEIFTTSLDNQTFVPIHVLQGEREMAADNRSLARFELTKIPPAPRGVPKIQVTFAVDAEGILSVEAKDLATSRSQAINVKPASGLTRDEIDRLVQEGEQFREADEQRRDLAEVRNQAEALLYTTEQALESYADLLSAERLQSLKQDAEALRDLLTNNGNIADIRASYAALEQATFEIAESLYGTSEGS